MKSEISGKAVLELKNVKTRFHTPRGMVLAVNGVSLSVEKGKTLGIVGESGCGKSALCKTILRLLPRSAVISAESEVIFRHMNLLHLSEKQLRKIRGKDLSVVLQDPMTSLNPVQTIGYQVAESLVCHLGMRRKSARNRAAELLDATGVPNPGERLGQYPHQLSGGLCQRVVIAMALSCDPEVLIADEPTTALDVTVQAQILSLLKRIQTERQMAMIFVTHDLGVAGKVADEIAVMYAGKIVEYGKTEKVFETPRMPYTKALTDSVLRLDHPPHTRLKSVNGQPPNLVHQQSGCCFAPRCPEGQPRCSREEPELTGHHRNHCYSCWHPVTT